MNRTLLARSGASLAVGAASGLAWTFGVSGLAFAPAAIAAWGWAPSRSAAWATMTAYFAVATSALGTAAPRFLEVGQSGAAALWLGCSAILGAVWAALWDRRVNKSYEQALPRTLGALVLTAVPPVGMIGLASPATAAGVWFPTWGWVGLAAFALLVPWFQSGRGLMSLAAVALFGALRAPAPPPSPEGWVAIETRVEHAAQLTDYGSQLDVALASMQRSSELEGEVKIFPESAAGVWSRTMEHEWRPHLRRMGRRGEREFVLGALVPRQGAGREFDSVALIMKRGIERGRYVQRVPVPFAMWRPWAEQTVRAHWRGRGTVMLDGRRAGILICYEQGLLWTTLQSMMEGANVLVSLGNAFWFRGTDAEAMGRLSMRSFGALFDVPVISAFNR